MGQNKGTIFVFLATGDQGRSTCHALLQDGFQVKGLTRNPNGAGAKALKDAGVELVQGDMADSSSYAEDLKGCDGAFVNADFWGPYYSNGLDADLAARTEGGQSKDAIDACVKAGVKHIVYSTLDDITPERPCPHFASKAAVSRYLKEQNIPHTNVYTSTYYNNTTKFGQLEKKADNSGWTYTLPAPDHVVLPAFASEQTGLWVREAFRNPEKWIGKNIYAVGENITVADFAKVLSEVSGKDVQPRHLSDEDFFTESFKKEITEELWIQYRMFYHKDMPRDVEACRKVVPEAWDVRKWAQNSKELRDLLGF